MSDMVVPLVERRGIVSAQSCSAGAGNRSLSFLAAGAGGLFASRTIFVLISARWLNLGTKPGVISAFAIAGAIVIAASLAGFGARARALGSIAGLRPLQWVLLYLAFSGCSLFWSASAAPAASALYWGSLVFDVAIILLLLRAFDVQCAVHSLMKGFIAGTCVLALVAWVMPAEGDMRLGDLDYFNTNQIGNLCALATLMAGLLASRGDGRWSITALFLGITLVRSLSKSTLVAYFACQAYRLAFDNSMSRRRKWLLALSAIAVTACFWSLLDAYYGVYTTAGNQAETLTGRTGIWLWAMNAGLNSPWLGNGFDAMWRVAPPFGGELFEARHAENELLQQFFAYGVCGVILLAGTYRSLYRQFRSMPRGAERSILTSFLVFVIVRGFAEAEPFDLLLPLWLITVLAVLAQSRMPTAQVTCEQANLRDTSVASAI